MFNGRLIDLIFTVVVPIVVLLRWLYTRNRTRLEMGLATSAIMHNKFPQALLLLVKMTHREIGEVTEQSLSLEPGKMQEKLSRLRLYVAGIDGCLEKMGQQGSTQVLESAIQLQIQLVSQRRLIKSASKNAAKKQKWKQITDQHEQNVRVIDQAWRQLQKDMQGRGK